MQFSYLQPKLACSWEWALWLLARAADVEKAKALGTVSGLEETIALKGEMNLRIYWEMLHPNVKRKQSYRVFLVRNSSSLFAVRERNAVGHICSQKNFRKSKYSRRNLLQTKKRLL